MLERLDMQREWQSFYIFDKHLKTSALNILSGKRSYVCAYKMFKINNEYGWDFSPLKAVSFAELYSYL